MAPVIDTISPLQQEATSWFRQLRDDICRAIEVLDADDTAVSQDIPHATFQRSPWNRTDNTTGEPGGGGEMSVLRDGRVFEKAGVNISTVWGQFKDEFRGRIPGTEDDPRFWASGISLVMHPRSPHVPITHFNTRMIVTGKQWFGGGGDLTPVLPNDAETQQFHQAFQQACDAADPEYYDKFKAWCDEYFYLPHRREPRGVGGIFYDYLDSGDNQDAKLSDFTFTQNVGKAFLDVYPKIVAANLAKPWGAEETAMQQTKRNRYVEFNLLYDRGTRFGLETGGNTEAILMSLPPRAGW